MDKQKNTTLRPISAEDAARAFREQSLEHERLYRESEARATLTVQMKLMRVSAGLSQAQLADRIGVKQPFIARLERGGFDRCEISTLRTIMRALGRDFDFNAMTRPLPKAAYNGASSCSALEAQFEMDDRHERRMTQLGTIRWAMENGNVQLASRSVEELKDRGVGSAA